MYINGFVVYGDSDFSLESDHVWNSRGSYEFYHRAINMTIMNDHIYHLFNFNIDDVRRDYLVLPVPE